MCGITDDDNIDVCDGIAYVINSGVVTPLNKLLRVIAKGLTVASVGIKDGFTYIGEGLDYALHGSINLINFAFDNINSIMGSIGQITDVIAGFFSGSFIKIIKSIIGLFFIIVLPDEYIPMISMYVSISFYVILFMIFGSPILCFLYLIL